MPTKKPKQYDPEEKVTRKVTRYHEEWGEVFVYKTGLVKKVKGGVIVKGSNIPQNPTGKGGEVTIEGYSTRDYAEIKEKIREAFALDCSVDEVMYYAGIHKSTLLAIFKREPYFLDECKRLKQELIFKARQRYAQEVVKNPEYALTYLEYKRPDEFSKVSRAIHDVNVYKPVSVIEVTEPYDDKI